MRKTKVYLWVHTHLIKTASVKTRNTEPLEGAQSAEGWKHTDNPQPFYPDTTEFLHWQVMERELGFRGEIWKVGRPSCR